MEADLSFLIRSSNSFRSQFGQVCVGRDRTGAARKPSSRKYNEGWRWSSSGIPRKAAANLAKHRVSFEEAATVFGDPLGRIVADPRHSAIEERLVLVGIS